MAVQVEAAHWDEAAKWSARLAAFVTLYIFAALLFQPSTFWTVSVLYLTKMVDALVVLLPVGLLILALAHGRTAPLRYAARKLRERGLPFAIIMLFFSAGMGAFTTFKNNIPDIVPFYADVWISETERWLLGKSPWRYAHQIKSEAWSKFIVDCYIVFWSLQWFVTVFFVALWSNSLARTRYLWALALTICVIGTVLAILLSSAGPIFYPELYGGPHFVELKSALDSTPPTEVIRKAARYLLTAYQDDAFDFGTGISAMPSVHVAIVVLNAYLLWSINRFIGAIGWAFALLIYYGSIYTGWHYAMDGIVSFLVVSSIWWATGRFVRFQPTLPLRPTLVDMHGLQHKNA